MTEPRSARAYEVLWSPYDQTWHVFFLDQLAEPTRLMFVALSGHAIPTRLVERTPSDSVYPPRERVVGLRLPDVPQLWVAG